MSPWHKFVSGSSQEVHIKKRAKKQKAESFGEKLQRHILTLLTPQTKTNQRSVGRRAQNPQYLGQAMCPTKLKSR